MCVCVCAGGVGVGVGSQGCNPMCCRWSRSVRAPSPCSITSRCSRCLALATVHTWHGARRGALHGVAHNTSPPAQPPPVVPGARAAGQTRREAKDAQGVAAQGGGLLRRRRGRRLGQASFGEARRRRRPLLKHTRWPGCQSRPRGRLAEAGRSLRPLAFDTGSGNHP